MLQAQLLEVLVESSQETQGPMTPLALQPPACTSRQLIHLRADEFRVGLCCGPAPQQAGAEELKKANKLVSLFHNLRTLLQRMNKTSYMEPAVAWTENVVRALVASLGMALPTMSRLSTASSLVLPPGPVGTPGGWGGV